MRWSLIIALGLVLSSSPASAQETKEEGKTPAEKQPKGEAVPEKPSIANRAVVSEMWDARAVLRRFEFAAMAHLERIRDPERRKKQLLDLLEINATRRNELGKLVEKRLPKDAISARGLHLLAELELDQWTTLSRVNDMPGMAGEVKNPAWHKRRAIRWYERLVEEHPSYPKLGEILDAVSQHHFDAGNHDKAKLALQRMLCGNHDEQLSRAQVAQGKADNIYEARVYAKSVGLEDYKGCAPRVNDRELIDDAWMRLGWLHRSSSGELSLAVSAYEQASDDPASPSYFVALQELAATYYESGQLIDAIPPLDLLIEYLDDMARQRPDELDETLMEVRSESVERSASILAELWRESALPKADASLELADIYFRGRGQGHVRDVFEELGSSLRGIGAFEQATTVWSHTIKRWPRHPRAPVIHDKLVKLLIETGNPSAADEQRERLIASFDRGSAWRAANQRDAAARERAGEIVAETLHALSTGHFRRAQKRYLSRSAKGNTNNTGAARASADDLALYDRAVGYARRVVDRFPNTERGYEAAFHLAQLELYRGRFLDAARRFRWVRDRDPLGKYALDSTLHMVEAYEMELARASASSEIALPAKPTQATLAGRPKPLALPPLVAEMRRAYDDLGAESSSAVKAADVLFVAAELSLRYFRIAEAETRYKTVVREYCQTARAKTAATRLAMINAARGAQTVGQRAQQLLNRACGQNAPVQVVRRARVKRLLVEAQRLRASDRHLEAGRSFYKAYQKGMPSDADYASTLLAAGEAFAEGGRGEISVKLLGLFATDATLAKHPIAARARWRLAQVHEDLFDYQRAVDAYLAVDATTGTVERGFDLRAKRVEALWRAAELREADRVYYDRGADDPGAATLFLRFASRVKKDRERASEAYLRAAVVYRRAGDPRKLEATYNAWHKAHGKGRGAARYKVHFHHAIAQARLAAGDRRGAASAFLSVVDAHRQLGGKREAETELAAEAAFWRAEDAYQREFRAHVFRWPEDGDKKKSERRVDALGRTLDRIEKQFKGVIAYGTGWSVAANVRMGDLYLGAFDKIMSAPIPAKLIESFKDEKVETLEMFSEMLRQAIAPLRERAGQEWRRARDDARKRGISNRWVRDAAQRLNTHIDPAKYPVQRAEVVVVEESP